MCRCKRQEHSYLLAVAKALRGKKGGRGMASMGRGGGRGPWTHWLGEDRKTETEEAGTTTWAQNCAKRRVEEHLEPRRTSLLLWVPF